MFEFLTSLYCNTIGWIFGTEDCKEFLEDQKIQEDMYTNRGSSIIYRGGSRKKTRKHRKHRKNKTKSNK